jgi:hypothetical protein
MKQVCALLESMWGWRGYNTAGEEAPRFFRINPGNHSGKRLYRICGDVNLIVTNSCRTVQKSASHHGTPDLAWVGTNLQRAKVDGCDLFLICGKVAQDTFLRAFNPEGLAAMRPYIFMDHPAARRWSNATIDAMTAQVREALR